MTPLGGAPLKKPQSLHRTSMFRAYSNPKARISPRVDPPARGFLLSAPPFSSTKVAPLDSEIAADFLVVEHMRLLGGVAHLFDRDRIEVGEEAFASPAYGRVNHPLKQHRV
jgi:hypothetical protein